MKPSTTSDLGHCKVAGTCGITKIACHEPWNFLADVSIAWQPLAFSYSMQNVQNT